MSRGLKRQSGIVLAEVVVAVGIVGVVATAVTGLGMLVTRIGFETERETVALGMANERIEQIRSLPFTDVGFTDGDDTTTNPKGVLEREEDLTPYTRVTDIVYQEGGPQAGYKKAVVQVTWERANQAVKGNVTLATYVAPPGVAVPLISPTPFISPFISPSPLPGPDDECTPGQVCSNFMLCDENNECPSGPGPGDDCVSGELCQGNVQCPANNICPPIDNPGDECVPDQVCTTGVCINGLCPPSTPPGDPCTPGQPSCEGGVMCPVNGLCPPPNPPGGPCTPRTPTCQGGLLCPASGLCPPSTPPGDPCIPGTPSCLGGLICPALGQCPSGTPPGGSCMPGDLCQGNVQCPANNVCPPIGNPGDQCVPNQVCSTGLCTNGTCPPNVPPGIPPGGSCTPGAPSCWGGQVCPTNGQCPYYPYYPYYGNFYLPPNPPIPGVGGNPACGSTIYAGTSGGAVGAYIPGEDSVAWQEVGNLSGAVTALFPYSGYLYAATSLGNVYQFQGNAQWQPVGNSLTAQISTMIVFNGRLHVGTSSGGGGAVYRFQQGADEAPDPLGGWEVVSSDNLALADFNKLSVYNGQLYAGLSNGGVAQLWRATIAPGNYTWSEVSALNGTKVNDMTPHYDGKLYIATDTSVIEYNGQLLGDIGIPGTEVKVLHPGGDGVLYAAGDDAGGAESTHRYVGGGVWARSLPTIPGNPVGGAVPTSINALYYYFRLHAGVTSGASDVYKYDNSDWVPITPPASGVDAGASTSVNVFTEYYCPTPPTPVTFVGEWFSGSGNNPGDGCDLDMRVVKQPNPNIVNDANMDAGACWLPIEYPLVWGGDSTNSPLCDQPSAGREDVSVDVGASIFGGQDVSFDVEGVWRQRILFGQAGNFNLTVGPIDFNGLHNVYQTFRCNVAQTAGSKCPANVQTTTVGTLTHDGDTGVNTFTPVQGLCVLPGGGQILPPPVNVNP